MPDRHPTVSRDSNLVTSPPIVTSASYRRRPRNFGMIGRSTPYSSNGEYLYPTHKPDMATLAAWDRARLYEPIIKEGLTLITLSVVAKVGQYFHVDPDIMLFGQANLPYIKRYISELTMSSLWAGWGVSEIIHKPMMGPNGPQVWLDDLVSYHPSQVDLVVNPNGRLTHGEKLPNTNLETGIWVPRPPNVTPSHTGNPGKVRLPKGKFVYTTHMAEGNNPYGTSMLSATLDYHLFKRAIFDLMMVALDRYGTPLVYVIVPHALTGELDPTDPEGERRLTLADVTSRELGDVRTESVMVFSQGQGDQEIKLGSLSTSNNFADSFSNAIELCDLNMMMAMGVPNLIMRDTSKVLGSSGASERQVELFHHFISAIYERVIDDFLNQAMLQLIQFNFDPRLNPLANHPGTINALPIRHSEIKQLVESIKMLTEKGFIDSSDPSDLDYVRQLFFIPSRAQAKVDPLRVVSDPVDLPSPEPTQPGQLISRQFTVGSEINAQ